MIKLKTNGLFDGYFTKIFKPIYVCSSSKESHSIQVPSKMKEYIELVNASLNSIFDCHYFDDVVCDDYNFDNNKKVMIAFSSGKDCVAVATKFLAKGYDVYLYHLKGVNRSYPQELEHSKKISEYLGCTFISESISVSGKCDYIENPTRNQFILAMMVDAGTKLGIYRYAFGNQLSDTLSVTNSDIMNSDSIELFDAIEKYYISKIPKFKLYTLLKDLTDSYCQISRYDSNLFPLISSCNGPLRFKAMRKKEKEDKFGFTLMPDRCGTCYKCANEAVVLNLLGVVSYPDDYILYCIDVMKKWTDKLYVGDNKPMWYDEKRIKKFVKHNKEQIKHLEVI